MENGTTKLLGLAGVAVARVERDDVADERARVVHVVTDDPGAACCPDCGTPSSSPKAWVTTRPKDLPYGPDPVELVWRKRRWRCQNPGCRRKTFTEAIEAVPPRMRTTTRLREAIAAGVEAGRAVDEVATAHGVSWPTAQRAVAAYAARELGEPEPTPLLGMDETRFGRPRWIRARRAGRPVGAPGALGDRVRRPALPRTQAAKACGTAARVRTATPPRPGHRRGPRPRRPSRRPTAAPAFSTPTARGSLAGGGRGARVAAPGATRRARRPRWSGPQGPPAQPTGRDGGDRDEPGDDEQQQQRRGSGRHSDPFPSAAGGAPGRGTALRPVWSTERARRAVRPRGRQRPTQCTFPVDLRSHTRLVGRGRRLMSGQTRLCSQAGVVPTPSPTQPGR